MTQARTESERNRDDMRRGKEHDTMPYFLTDHFREILEASQKQKSDMKKAQEGAAAGKKKPGEGGQEKGPAGLYKSIFLRNKVE